MLYHSWKREIILQESGVRSYEEAINNSKPDNLTTHHTWKYEELPPSQKSIGSRGVFKEKYNSDETIDRIKAGLIAQGFRH